MDTMVSEDDRMTAAPSATGCADGETDLTKAPASLPPIKRAYMLTRLFSRRGGLHSHVTASLMADEAVRGRVVAVGARAGRVQVAVCGIEHMGHVALHIVQKFTPFFIASEAVSAPPPRDEAIAAAVAGFTPAIESIDVRPDACMVLAAIRDIAHRVAALDGVVGVRLGGGMIYVIVSHDPASVALHILVHWSVFELSLLACPAIHEDALFSKGRVCGSVAGRYGDRMLTAGHVLHREGLSVSTPNEGGTGGYTRYATQARATSPSAGARRVPVSDSRVIAAGGNDIGAFRCEVECDAFPARARNAWALCQTCAFTPDIISLHKWGGASDTWAALGDVSCWAAMVTVSDSRGQPLRTLRDIVIGAASSLPGDSGGPWIWKSVAGPKLVAVHNGWGEQLMREGVQVFPTTPIPHSFVYASLLTEGVCQKVCYTQAAQDELYTSTASSRIGESLRNAGVEENSLQLGVFELFGENMALLTTSAHWMAAGASPDLAGYLYLARVGGGGGST